MKTRGECGKILVMKESEQSSEATNPGKKGTRTRVYAQKGRGLQSRKGVG